MNTPRACTDQKLVLVMEAKNTVAEGHSHSPGDALEDPFTRCLRVYPIGWALLSRCLHAWVREMAQGLLR